jgi:hypothetical protein
VNLLIYLPDQLLKGCQFAENQFQALQNQAIGGFLRVCECYWNNHKHFFDYGSTTRNSAL